MGRETDEERDEATLSPETRERLRQFAEAADRSVDDVLRIGRREFLARGVSSDDRDGTSPKSETSVRADDPFFSYEPAGTTGEELSAANVDEFLYGPPDDG